MGICSSKAHPKGSKEAALPSDQQSALKQSVDGQTNPSVDSAPTVEQAPAAAVVEPKTPYRDVDDDIEPPVHTYNSAEKPYRSAMRTSESRSDSYSRRSSAGVSNVGFSVNMLAPDAGPPGLTVNTPKKSPRANGCSVRVSTPTSSSAASADGDDDTEQHRSFAGADSISLKKILDIFYDKVVASPQIGSYFNGIDMIKLKRHQLRFMTLAFGGKELVNEEDPNLNLRKIHYHLIRDKGLDLEHWEVFVGLFDETMNQLEKDIPLETREAAMRSIYATKHYFVPIGQETEYTNTTIGALPVSEGPPLKCPFAAGEGETRV